MFQPASPISLLEEDPDLGLDLEGDRLLAAREACIVPSVTMRRGEWPLLLPDVSNGFGFLVVEGLVLRTVVIDSRYGSELMGQGDLIRPWRDEEGGSVVSPRPLWRVLTPTRLARLDLDFGRAIASYPELSSRLVGRATQRARNLGILMAIVHQPRIHVRLRMLMWHLADRWGRVVPEGVSLMLPLTHSVLAELIATRRPTVTSTLGELAREEIVIPVPGGWLLRGGPPQEIFEDSRIRSLVREAPPV